MYEDNHNQIGLSIFKKDGLLLKRYIFFGGAGPMDDYSYGTFNTADPKETIIVVFGSNKGNGSRYELKTHDKTYNEDISDQQDVLKVYRLFNKDTQGMNTWGTLTVYDKDNNEIDLYK